MWPTCGTCATNNMDSLCLWHAADQKGQVAQWQIDQEGEKKAAGQAGEGGSLALRVGVGLLSPHAEKVGPPCQPKAVFCKSGKNV